MLGCLYCVRGVWRPLVSILNFQIKLEFAVNETPSLKKQKTKKLKEHFLL